MAWAAEVSGGVVIDVALLEGDPPSGWVASATKIGIGWAYDGETFTAPAPVSQTLEQQRANMVASPVQMRLALLAAGMLDEVNAAAAADPQAALVWDYATQIYRTSAFISALAAGFTNPNTDEIITDAEIDALFAAAAAIDP